MGMFDSTLVSFPCPVCGFLSEDGQAEVQFKVYVGGRHPGCHTILVGDLLQGMPPIPVYEDVGFYCCGSDPECEGEMSEYNVRLRFERGRLVSAAPLVVDEEGYANPPIVGLPRPRKARKTRREHAAVEERRRRHQAEIDAEIAAMPKDLIAGLGVDSRFLRLGMTMAQPIRAQLNYSSLMRRMFVVEQMGTKRVGPYIKLPDGAWQRELQP